MHRRNKWFSARVRNFQWHRIQDIHTASTKDEVLIVYGHKGIGKTSAAIAFCQSGSNRLYFSFKNIDADIAPVIFSEHLDTLPPSDSWNSFFENIKHAYGAHGTFIIFDDVDARNDKTEFYQSVDKFLHSDKRKLFTIVFLTTSNDKLPLATTSLEMKPMSIGDISKAFNKLNRADTTRLHAVTAGIPELVAHYNDNLTYEENLRNFLTAGSRYIRFMEDTMTMTFRTPESYNTLLYAMSAGKNRISELAACSGFANNKCDKYVKALIAAQLAKRVKTKENGKTVSHYVPANTYIKLWYKWIFPHRRELMCGFSDEMLAQTKTYIDEELVPESFRQACFRYFLNKEHLSNSVLDNLDNFNRQIGGYDFDIVMPSEKYRCFIKICPQVNSRYDKKELLTMLKAAECECPYYNSEFYLFLNGRFSDYVWKEAGKYDNLKLVQTEWLGL